MYNSPKQKGVALKKWPLDANDVSLFKGYLKKIISEGGHRQTNIPVCVGHHYTQIST
jgi:hypothetical protein